MGGLAAEDALQDGGISTLRNGTSNRNGALRKTTPSRCGTITTPTTPTRKGEEGRQQNQAAAQGLDGKYGATELALLTVGPASVLCYSPSYEYEYGVRRSDDTHRRWRCCCCRRHCNGPRPSKPSARQQGLSFSCYPAAGAAISLSLLCSPFLCSVVLFRAPCMGRAGASYPLPSFSNLFPPFPIFSLLSTRSWCVMCWKARYRERRHYF